MSLKKILQGYLIFKLLLRFGAFGVLFVLGDLDLPKMVYVSTAVVCCLGLILLGAGYFHKTSVSIRHYLLFCVVDFISVLFNLVDIGLWYPMAVSLWEIAVFGSFLDLIVDVILAVSALRTPKYVTIAQTETVVPERKKKFKKK